MNNIELNEIIYMTELHNIEEMCNRIVQEFGRKAIPYTDQIMGSLRNIDNWGRYYADDKNYRTHLN